MSENSQQYLLDQLAGHWRGEPFPYAPPFTPYHEQLVAEFTPQIELDSSNGLSPQLRDKITVSGTGSVTNNGAEHVVATGADPDSDADLQTQERGRYQPGIVALAGHEIRRPTPMTGDQEIWWELGDGIDGARVGEDGTGVYIQHRHALGNGPKIYQGNWNVDNLDGSEGYLNGSKATLDLAYPSTWRTIVCHYGAGPLQILAQLRGPNNRSIYVVVHEFMASQGRTLFQIPRLPLREYASNGTAGGNVELFVGGREFAVLGRYNPNRRKTTAFTDGDVPIVTAELRPIISFRKKDLRKWLSRSVKVAGMSLPSDTDGYWEIIVGGSLDIDGTGLTDTDWVDIPGIAAQETAVQYNRSANGISGGIRVDGDTLVSGQGNSFGLSGIDGLGLDIPDDAIVTLAAQAKSSNGNTFGTFKLEEEA